jgi:hypothetical protein
MVRATAVSNILLLGSLPPVDAFPGNHEPVCVAREEFAYGPMGYWLVRVTLEITQPGGAAFATSLQGTMPWQAAPLREGQTFLLGRSESTSGFCKKQNRE